MSPASLGSTLDRLSDDELAAIAWADDAIPTAEIARRLGTGYHTVYAARRRIREAGGWRCPLQTVACAHCDAPLLTSAAPGHARTVHVGCRPAFDRERQRRNLQRLEGARPGTLYARVKRFRAKHPDAARALQQRAQAATRERRRAVLRADPERAAPVFVALKERLLAAQQESVARADQRGARWSAEDDRRVAEAPDETLPALAAELRRTVYAVNHRRYRLRAWGRMDPPRRANRAEPGDDPPTP